MPKYMIAPADAKSHDNLEAAIKEATDMCNQHGAEVGDFVVYEIKEIGRVVYARPIYVEATPEPLLGPLDAITKYPDNFGSSDLRAVTRTVDLDDEIPF